MDNNQFIPESVVHDIKEVKRMLGCGYISAEEADKRLEGIEADFKKLQGMVTPDKIEAIQTKEATELTLPLLDELEQLSETEWKKLMYGGRLDRAENNKKGVPGFSSARDPFLMTATLPMISPLEVL